MAFKSPRSSAVQNDPSQGIDTDLEVNFIEIDGQRFQTEAATTFSTGTFANGGITPGFFQSQILHTNGIFSFGADPGGGGGGDTIQIVARGDEGFEQFVLTSNGVEVGSGTVGTQFQTFTFSTNNLTCLLYTSPSPRDRQKSRMPSSA